MVLFGSFVLILNMLCQAGLVSVDQDTVFSPAEKTQLTMENSVERRIKIYQSASVRIQKNMHQSVAKEDFQTIPDDLKTWISLLVKSLEDIENNLKSKKKPRSLINYEIHVRKAISDLQGIKIKAPAEQQDDFDSCIAQAASIRKKFVEILFKLKS
jgi:hypothetical protein